MEDGEINGLMIAMNHWSFLKLKLSAFEICSDTRTGFLLAGEPKVPS